MPKVTYSSSKGLIQEPGTTGINLGGNTTEGAVKKVYSISTGNVATAGDLTLTAADSGCIIKLVDTRQGVAITLPSPTAGMTFIVTYGAATPGGDTTFTPGSGVFKVIQVKGGANSQAAASNNKLVCKTASSTAGSNAIVTCDGTNWYVDASAHSNHNIFQVSA